jgi:hypothetical protein
VRVDERPSLQRFVPFVGDIWLQPMVRMQVSTFRCPVAIRISMHTTKTLKKQADDNDGDQVHRARFMDKSDDIARILYNCIRSAHTRSCLHIDATRF